MLKQDVKIFSTILGIFAGLCAGMSQAATSVNAQVTTMVFEALTITNQQPLNFGHITPTAGGGTVVISTSGVRTVNGGVQVAGSFNHASFAVQGAPDRAYSIHTPASQIFVSDAVNPNPALVNALTVNNFTTESVNHGAPSATGQLSHSGADTIYLGGTLVVPANAVSGVYSGLVPVTVSY